MIHPILFAAAAPIPGNLIFLVAVIAMMYFVLFRPQLKQAKEHRALLASLKKGDEVVTQGGVLGKIATVGDRLVTLEVASGVKIRVLKSSVQGRASAEETPAASSAKDEPKEEK